jgi:hypothetical protein
MVATEGVWMIGTCIGMARLRVVRMDMVSIRNHPTIHTMWKKVIRTTVVIHKLLLSMHLIQIALEEKCDTINAGGGRGLPVPTKEDPDRGLPALIGNMLPWRISISINIINNIWADLRRHDPGWCKFPEEGGQRTTLR